MGRRNKLLTARWLFGHLLALVLVTAFFNFGLWQLRRLDQRRVANAVLIERITLPTASLADALPAGGAAEVPEYLSVTARGSFLPEAEVLLRGRSRDGRPGFHLLTPLLLSEAGGWAGKLLLVERGWVPYDHDSVPVAAALPPPGEVVVTGRLRAPRTPPSGPLAVLAPRDPAQGALTQSFYVDVGRLAAQMPGELVPAYLELTAQAPAQLGELPRPLGEPDLSEGSHLGYAIQWFAFFVIGVVGYLLLLRSVTRPPARV